MNGRKDDAPVPELYLERFRLGEVRATEQKRIERLLEIDPALRERLDALESSEEEIARRLPAPAMAETIRDRARDAGLSSSGARPAWSSRRWLAPALAAAAVVVLAVSVNVLRSPGTDDRTPGILLKGGDAELVVYRKTADGSERLAPGAATVPGDLVRIGYRAAGRPYGAIVSADGQGNVTQHLPRSGERATPLEAGGTVLLDFSYELDDAPRWERFYLVTADEPFDLEPVRRAALAVATAGSASTPPPLSLAGGLEQSVFSLTKESVP